MAMHCGIEVKEVMKRIFWCAAKKRTVAEVKATENGRNENCGDRARKHLPGSPAGSNRKTGDS
jgi:hypothetical protein